MPATKKTTQPKRKIGAHVSAAGGVDQAIKRAADMGCNCVQVFSGSPRGWARREISEQPVDKLFSEQLKYNVSPIFTHSLYLVNLVSENPSQRKKSHDAIVYDLAFDSAINGAGVVVHLGSHQGRGWEAVREQLAAEIADILAVSPDDCSFLIENSAGQSGKLCSDLGEIRWLLDEVNDDRLGWCFDTCHAHAAGYYLGKEPDQIHLTTEITQKSGPTQPESADGTITQLRLWEALKCIHVNDSRDPFGSSRDRHENIGDGQITSADLKYFLSLSQIASIPLITEVPGIDGKGPDAENISRIKRLVQ